VIEVTIRLRYDYDPTTTYRARLLPFYAIRREQKINISVFRRSRVVAVSQSNRNCDIGLKRIAPILSLSSAESWPAKGDSAYAILDMIRPVNNIL